MNSPQDAALEIGRLRRRTADLKKAMGHLPVDSPALKELQEICDELRAKIDALKPLARQKVTCTYCYGSGREGHGESCGACSGGKTPGWHAVGEDPV